MAFSLAGPAINMHEGGDDPPRARPSKPSVEDEFGDATEIQPSQPSGASSGPSVSGGPSSKPRHDSVSERAAKRKEKDPRVGQVLLGRYRLEKPIAKGGMGRVYLATQLQLGRSVAVKILNAEFKETDPQFVKRFSVEASISAKLSHPNVVTVHDYGEAETGELFMAMELLRGKTLSQVIQKEAPFAPARTIHIALQIARALRDAHAMGIIHRDLKPGNVMLIEAGDDSDFVKVLDFGLVKLFIPEGQAVGLPEKDEEDLTRAGTLLGSPRYMSPEQIRGLTLDPRTDIYSFGIMLFQMAAGRPPFTGSGSVDLIYKHIHEPPPRVGEVANVDCPPELETLIARCLEKDRDKRYASMGDLIAALKEARQSITGIIVRPGGDTGPLASNVDRPPASSERSIPPSYERSDRASLTPSERPRPPDRSPRSPDEPTRSGPLASVREAAFLDVASQDASRSVAMPRPRRWPLYLGLTGVFAGAALFAALTFAPKTRPPEALPEPVVLAPIAEARTIELEFRSDPSGATIKDDGKVIGVTPFSSKLPALPDGAPKIFTAELPGYLEAKTEQRLDSSRVVMLILTQEPAPVVEVVDDEVAEEPAPSPTKRRTIAGRKTSKRKTEPTESAEPDDKKPARYRNNPY